MNKQQDGNLGLADQDREDALVAFMQTLTDFWLYAKVGPIVLRPRGAIGFGAKLDVRR